MPADSDVAPLSAVPVTAPLAATPVAPAPTVAEAPVAAPSPVPAEDNSGALAIAAILAGVVGLGAAGALAMRRRRSNVDAYETGYDEVYEPGAAPIAEPMVTAEPVEVREYATADAADEPATGWAVAQDDVRMPFAMPVGPVPSGEAREALLEQMVAAQPDAANPFKSPAARRKRARIILQSRAQEQREAATAPFDFRTYKPEFENESSLRTVDA
jgi:hypothetical protein